MSFIKQCKFLVWYFFIAFTCTMYTVTLPANIVISIVTNSVSKHIHTVHTHCKNGVVMYKCVGLVYFKKIHVDGKIWCTMLDPVKVNKGRKSLLSEVI